LRVFTSRDAASLLTELARGAPLSTLGAALGFGDPLPLDRAARTRLGLAANLRRVRVQPGPGTLRALLITTDALPEAEWLSRLARGVARGAPERAWLILALDAAATQLSIAAPSADARTPLALYTMSLGQLRESDAETLAALVGCREGPDLMVHLRWRETLGRTALTRRFYQELERCVTELAVSAEGRAGLDARRTIALLHSSRLLFISFLEARGWLDDNREFLRAQFTRCASGGFAAHRRLLEPLWFGTLNTPMAQRAPAARAFGRVPFLNGGLFTRSPIERLNRDVRLSDAALEQVIGGLLSRYRLTPRESRDDWAEAAVDPEMLGRAFESLMHEGLRRSRGAFYTPPALIAQLTRDGLAAALTPLGVSEEQLQRAWEGERLTRRARTGLSSALDAMRVLDPACGSGAFLVYALEELANLRRTAGDERPAGARRRDVLTRCIYGVDVDPTAVWLCQLRLWLSVVVEEDETDPMRLPPLPNLDRNIREGDALAGRGFDDGWLPSSPNLEARRLRYARAIGKRKRTLARALERDERQRAIHIERAQEAASVHERRELLRAARAPDLFGPRRGADRAMRLRLSELKAMIRRTRAQVQALERGAALPFSWLTHFPEPAQRGGFSLVIGNPPWVRTHAIAAEQRAALRERFSVFRLAAWDAGAAEAAAGRGFASQVDLAALFTERAVRLTQRDGAVALLLPAKLWGSLAGGGLRQFLAAQAPPLLLEEWQETSAGFDAVVYPSALVARRRGATPSGESLRVVVHRHEIPLPWSLPRARLALDETPGAPWLLLPTEVRDAFEVVSAAGVPLSRSALARPQLGVKCGLNEAFVLTQAEAEREAIERQCLRPLLRGEHLAAWRPLRESERAAIVWTHDAKGAPLRVLPERTERHLARWRRQLEQRSDGRGGPWWALFRTEAARSDQARVVWGDIGRAPRAVVLTAGDPTVPLNTCYVVRTPRDDDGYALAALLNSTLGAAWLSALAEPARGGYRRFLGWTCARFPIPREWPRARALLAPLARAAVQGVEPNPWELTDAVLDAYQLPQSAVAALLSWHML
jgi:methylase of polypeptide subunit release factors